MHLDFVHPERVRIRHGILLKELEMVQVAIVAELHVVYVSLALRPQTLTLRLEPQLGHLLQTLLGNLQLQVLHQLITPKQVPIRLIILMDLVQYVVVRF